MKSKTIVKLVIDTLMTISLLLLIGYHLWGERFHEWAGVVSFILFIGHHLLNKNWHKSLLKGKYNAIRIIFLAIDILIFASMVAQMYSGILMSRYVFEFLPFGAGLAFARKIHILGSYWGYLFVGLHLGLHWSMILNRFIKKDKPVKSNKGKLIGFTAGLIVSLYGVWAFFKRDFLTYLLLKSEFVFLDYSESKILFYIDYLAIMGLCIFVAHYGRKLIIKRNKFENRSSK